MNNIFLYTYFFLYFSLLISNYIFYNLLIPHTLVVLFIIVTFHYNYRWVSDAQRRKKNHLPTHHLLATVILSASYKKKNYNNIIKLSILQMPTLLFYRVILSCVQFLREIRVLTHPFAIVVCSFYV